MQVVKIYFSLFNLGIAVLQIRPSQPERFNLSTHQRNPCLIALQYVIKMMSLAVGRDYFNLFFILLHIAKYIMAARLWQANSREPTEELKQLASAEHGQAKT